MKDIRFCFEIKSPDKYASKYDVELTELFKNELDLLQQFCNVFGCAIDTEPEFNFDEDEIYYNNGDYSFSTNICFVCKISEIIFVSHSIRCFAYYHKYKIINEWFIPE